MIHFNLVIFTLDPPMLSLIPPVLIDNNLELDFKENQVLCLATKCSPVNNRNALLMPVKFNSKISLEINFNDGDSLKIIKGPDINKTQDHCNLPVRKTKKCDSGITLSIIVKSWIFSWIFEKKWILFQHIRYEISKFLIIRDQFLYFILWKYI